MVLFQGKTEGLKPFGYAPSGGIIVKQEFLIKNIAVEVYYNGGIEIHVMGGGQDKREDGVYWFSVRLNGETEEYVSPLNEGNEEEFIVYSAIVASVLGRDASYSLVREGFIPGTDEFDKLVIDVMRVKREIWEMGIILPIDPTMERWVSLGQIFAMAPILGAPEISYSQEGTITSVEFGNYGIAMLEEDSAYWNEGKVDVAYLWRRKKG